MGKLLEIIRLTYFGLIMGVTGILGLIVSVFRPFHKNNTYPIARFMRIVVTPFLGLSVKVSGREIADAARPCVFVSNHQNNFDIVMAAETVPPGVVSLGKKQIVWFPIFGWFYWLSGHVLIDRSNRKKAFASMQKVKDAINVKGTSVWIMPEGTRSKGRGLAPFKKGAFHTAVQAQCPVVPIAISSWDKNVDLKRFRKNYIRVSILEAIPTKGMGTEDVNTLREKCETIVRQEIDRLDQEIADRRKS